MPKPHLLAVCRVHALLPDAGTVGVTAIDKRPVEGTVDVDKLGLRGDIQADRQNHGGEDQALYAYSQEDADVWAAALGRDIPAGLFGENLRTVGMETTGAVFGERWRIGSTLVVEATSPRQPCATFQRWMGEQQWVRRFTEEGRIGTYLRVVSPGSITAGDPIRLIYRPVHGVTIGRWFSEATVEQANSLLDAAADGDITLVEDMRISIDKVLRTSAPR
jgi:MOSC domain-containing protein YiiM